MDVLWTDVAMESRTTCTGSAQTQASLETPWNSPILEPVPNARCLAPPAEHVADLEGFTILAEPRTYADTLSP